MSPLEVWYDHLDAQTIIDMAPNAKIKKNREQLIEKAKVRVGDYLYPMISSEVAGRRRLIDQPPVLFHIYEKDFDKRVHAALQDYRLSLPHERRILFDRYRLEDFAVKAVGIGSVGTYCFVGLFFSAENHPLLLQFKEACPSVLGPYAGKSEYENQGQRIVTGQRLMQSSSDIFLGWTQGQKGRHFFVRQLRDMKMSAPIEGATTTQMKLYAELCGRTLARAHAKSGDAALISGYLGKSDSFDQAIGRAHQIAHLLVQHFGVGRRDHRFQNPGLTVVAIQRAGPSGDRERRKAVLATAFHLDTVVFLEGRGGKADGPSDGP